MIAHGQAIDINMTRKAAARGRAAGPFTALPLRSYTRDSKPEVPMPLPLAPLLPVMLRIGVVATTTIALTRLVGSAHPGRTDQRAEDALDELGEGLAVHRPADRAEDRQTNASARLRRVIRFRGRAYEVDAGLMARFRLRERAE